MKKNAGWVEAALNAVRSAPALPLFAACWDGLLNRLAAEGEPHVRGTLLEREGMAASACVWCRRCVLYL